MKSEQHLKESLRRIDRKGYKAYKEVQDNYDFGDYTLSIDHVQGDPFAAPSRISVIVSQTQVRSTASLRSHGSAALPVCPRP